MKNVSKIINNTIMETATKTINHLTKLHHLELLFQPIHFDDNPPAQFAQSGGGGAEGQPDVNKVLVNIPLGRPSGHLWASWIHTTFVVEDHLSLRTERE